MTATTTELPRWDLSDLYAGHDDPKLDEHLSDYLKRAQAFEEKFQSKICAEDLSADTLLEALETYESMMRLAGKVGSLASLLFSTDTTDAARGALVQKVREKSSRASTHLLFFPLEIGEMPSATFERLMADEKLAAFRHYLKTQREAAKHHLSKSEETILEETANSRGRAFRRLFTEVTSRMKFQLEIDGEVQELTQSDLLAYNYDPDREMRQKASVSLAEELQNNAHVLTFIMNTLVSEKEVIDRLRGFDEPESERHLDNELPAAAVDAMVSVCVKNYDIVAEYYRLKGQLLGLDELKHYDRYAPLKSEESTISYERARDIVLEAYRAFSPDLAALAEPFFTENWIDVPVQKGKRGGAFCAGVTPDHHPYVLLNYTQKPRDVMTLAHELGHGVHDRLAAKNHALDYHPVLPMAETASTFGEMLVFEKLYAELDNDKERLALICEKLEDTFATVFRQVAMFRFEQRLHRARRERGELTTEDINQLWQECQQEMFGDSLSLEDDHKWTWLYIPHIVQWPFYVYAYAFGELLVLSLYARYKKEGDAFIPLYFALLEAGGSREPTELLKTLDIDITSAEFWQGGCDLVRSNLERAKTLVQAAG